MQEPKPDLHQPVRKSSAVTFAGRTDPVQTGRVSRPARTTAVAQIRFAGFPVGLFEIGLDTALVIVGMLSGRVFAALACGR